MPVNQVVIGYMVIGAALGMLTTAVSLWAESDSPAIRDLEARFSMLEIYLGRPVTMLVYYVVVLGVSGVFGAVFWPWTTFMWVRKRVRRDS